MADDTTAVARRDGDALLFSGALQRDAAADLWRQTFALLPGTSRFDLTAVAHVDSAGLAVLAELAARADGDIRVTGDPPGLSGLRAAYRLSPTLGFAG